MKKFEADLNIYMVPDSDAPDGYRIQLVEDAHKWYTHADSINLGKTTVCLDLDIPSDDQLAVKAIETLKAKQDQIMADAFDRKVELQSKINKLTLITHQYKEDINHGNAT